MNSNKTLHRIKSSILAHKVSAVIIVLIIIFSGYYFYTKLTSTTGETRYVVANVEKGTLINSITGSGQVSASNQIDLKPKVSGDVTYIGIQDGQEVKAGTLIIQLDDKDAQKNVRDAEVNLESAKIALQKLKQPADELSMTQAENSLSQAKEDLQKAYDGGFNNVSDTFLDLPAVMSGVQDILYGTTVSKGSQYNISSYGDMVKDYDENVLIYRDDAANKYKTARDAYDANFNDYKMATRFSDNQAIEKLINETYDTTKTVADAVKSANDLLNFVKDRLTSRQQTIPAILTTHQNSLSTYTSQTNSHLLTLYDVRNTIVSSARAITEKSQSLDKLKNGADPLDIQSQELSIKQKENSLQDAQNALDDYYVRAPFDGTVAKLNVKKYDSISPATVVATLVTRQKMAELSLNEVDAAKVKVGQKATLTFDAVDGLSIAGSVVEIDAVGTVTQGVVTYTVKIGFDTQDDRVKTGMSVSAAIVTDVKQDILMVPNSAVKTRGGNSYVEMFGTPLSGDTSSNQGIPSTATPRQQTVETGLSNDTSTEIVNGLKEGDQIVVRTITAQTIATTATAPSLFGSGGRGGGGGAIRIPGR